MAATSCFPQFGDRIALQALCRAYIRRAHDRGLFGREREQDMFVFFTGAAAALAVAGRRGDAAAVTAFCHEGFKACVRLANEFATQAAA